MCKTWAWFEKRNSLQAFAMSRFSRDFCPYMEASPPQGWHQHNRLWQQSQHNWKSNFMGNFRGNVKVILTLVEAPRCRWHWLAQSLQKWKTPPAFNHCNINIIKLNRCCCSIKRFQTLLLLSSALSCSAQVNGFGEVVVIWKMCENILKTLPKAQQTQGIGFLNVIDCFN